MSHRYVFEQSRNFHNKERVPKQLNLFTTEYVVQIIKNQKQKVINQITLSLSVYFIIVGKSGFH